GRLRGQGALSNRIVEQDEAVDLTTPALHDGAGPGEGGTSVFVEVIPRRNTEMNGEYIIAYKTTWDLPREKAKSRKIRHPQFNGLAEAANKQILKSLQKSLEDKKGKLLFELRNTPWSLNTTKRESTWQMPFRLVYGTEALMPVEMGSTLLRVQMY
ncbi:Dihydroorotase, partial [Bienertia sinuspersici]